jgi:hypothetical protein
MINESSTVSDWTRMASPTSPYMFKDGTEENINIICDLLKENKYSMFLRKVHKSFPDSILKDIMNKDFGHTYELLHNNAKKKNNFFISLRFTSLQTILLTGFILLVGFCFITSGFTKVCMYSPFFC